MTELRQDDSLLDAASLAFAMLRFAESAAHPSHGATPPDRPRLGAEAYMFAPSSRQVLLNEVPAFLASLPSPALLMPTLTQGVIALLLLDELSGERAAEARHQFANQRAAVDMFAAQLGLTEDSSILLESGDEPRLISLAALRLWSERFALDIGWSMRPLQGDPRATACLDLVRSDGVSTRRDLNRDTVLALTADVPIAYHSDGDMILAALRRHVPAVLETPADAKRVTVWFVLDEDGRVENTSVSLEALAPGRRTMREVFLQPFPGESISSFASAGVAVVPTELDGANHIKVWWLQRAANVHPDPANGVYQFDSLRLLPARSTLETVVKERYPNYARAGLSEVEHISPDQEIVPWFIVNHDGAVLESWLGPYLQHSLLARRAIEERHSESRFGSVRIGEIATENGARAPIVWASLER